MQHRIENLIKRRADPLPIFQFSDEAFFIFWNQDSVLRVISDAERKSGAVFRRVLIFSTIIRNFKIFSGSNLLEYCPNQVLFKHLTV